MWVDWHNTSRLHSAIDHLPPIEYEQSYYDQLNTPRPAHLGRTDSPLNRGGSQCHHTPRRVRTHTTGAPSHRRVDSRSHQPYAPRHAAGLDRAPPAHRNPGRGRLGHRPPDLRALDPGTWSDACQRAGVATVATPGPGSRLPTVTATRSLTRLRSALKPRARCRRSTAPAPKQHCGR